MPLSPYLSFAGNCSDAIAYYQRTLGAELLYKISFGEMPKSTQDSAENCPSGMQFPDTAIAHANVRIAGSDIMMSDAIPVSYTHLISLIPPLAARQRQFQYHACSRICRVSTTKKSWHSTRKADRKSVV